MKDNEKQKITFTGRQVHMNANNPDSVKEMKLFEGKYMIIVNRGCVATINIDKVDKVSKANKVDKTEKTEGTESKNDG